jgi:hypothetical protein
MLSPLAIFGRLIEVGVDGEDNCDGDGDDDDWLLIES